MFEGDGRGIPPQDSEGLREQARELGRVDASNATEDDVGASLLAYDVIVDWEGNAELLLVKGRPSSGISVCDLERYPYRIRRDRYEEAIDAAFGRRFGGFNPPDPLHAKLHTVLRASCVDDQADDRIVNIDAKAADVITGGKYSFGASQGDGA